METTIRLNVEVKKQLDSFKIHPRETYNEVIKRVMNSPKATIDEESLIETIEVLGNPEAMRNIAEALERFNKGDKGVSWEDMKKELNLNV